MRVWGADRGHPAALEEGDPEVPRPALFSGADDGGGGGEGAALRGRAQANYVRYVSIRRFVTASSDEGLLCPEMASRLRIRVGLLSEIIADSMLDWRQNPGRSVDGPGLDSGVGSPMVTHI